MTYLPPITSQTADNIKTVTKYVDNLSNLVAALSPINITYELSLNELDDNSYEITVSKKINGVLDTTVSPINKKFFFSKTYSSLINLNLHSYNGSITLKSETSDLSFEHLFKFCEYAHTSARKSITLQRYKGLGEMNPDQLSETTMDPKTRSLLQVSQIHDDDYSIFDTLMGDDVEKRRDFIVSSANAVENVDV